MKKIPGEYESNSILDHKDETGKVDKRVFYGEDGYFNKHIHTDDHGNPEEHPYGINGEHVHYYEWNNGKATKVNDDMEISDEDRILNSDILPSKGDD